MGVASPMASAQTQIGLEGAPPRTDVAIAETPSTTTVQVHDAHHNLTTPGHARTAASRTTPLPNTNSRAAPLHPMRP